MERRPAADEEARHLPGDAADAPAGRSILLGRTGMLVATAVRAGHAKGVVRGCLSLVAVDLEGERWVAGQEAEQISGFVALEVGTADVEGSAPTALLGDIGRQTSEQRRFALVRKAAAPVVVWFRERDGRRH